MGGWISAIQRLCHFSRNRSTVRGTTSFQRKGDDIWGRNETFCGDGMEVG